MPFQSETAPGRLIRTYALALLIFAAAVVLRLLLDYIIPGRLPFITFFPAVLLAAFYCGLGPSILVLALSTIVGTVWAEPSGENKLAFYVASGLLFVGMSGVNIALVQYLMTALAQLNQKDQQLGLINRELKHRIKNLFSIANAICLQTIKAGGPPDKMSEAVSGRIMAIAATQDVLSATASEGADLRELIGALVATLAPDPSRIAIEGKAVRVPAETTTPFALILHELATNALKYGAWSQDVGLVEVSWSDENSALNFLWREHDGPVVAPPMREGLGRTLIKSSLPGATVTHDLRADGLECRIRLPLPGQAAQA